MRQPKSVAHQETNHWEKQMKEIPIQSAAIAERKRVFLVLEPMKDDRFASRIRNQQDKNLLALRIMNQQLL